MKAVRIILLALFTIAALAYLNIIVPKATTSAHVSNFSHTDSCGKSPTNGLQVTMQDDTCGGFYKSGNDYSTTGKITNTSGSTINNIQLHFKTYFCDKQSELTSSGACLHNEHDHNGPVFSLKPGESITFSTPTLHSSDYGSFNSCGLFQNDFWFSYNSGSCTSTLNGSGTGFGFAGVGYCKLWDGHTLKSSNPWSPAWECTKQPTPTPTKPVTPTPTVPVTPSVTPPPHLIVKKHVINDNGGTKHAHDFTIFVKNANSGQILSQSFGSEYGTTITLPSSVLYTVYEGTHDGYDQTFLGDCSGMVANGHTKVCTLINNDIPNGTPTPTPSVTQTPTPTPTGEITPTPTTTQGCQSDCGDHNTTVTVNQQQQQQLVLAASVAPAPTTTQLPSTGADDFAVIGTLLSLLPIGWKLKKLV